ncbi:hypothetical protein IJ732_01670, partial [bacterium]|nr:hypothetical protein [bacterium]
YKQSPDKFKEYLESHLKILSSDCEQDVCLADGSSYSYECDETKCNSIIIDTNGDKRPNSAGKDRYRMLVTDHGLIAQGESEYCGTIDGGLDCGKYILTYHKLFDGLINNCTAYDNGECSQCENGYQNNGTSCRDIRENTCDTYSGTTCTKCTSENLLVGGECISMSSLKCDESEDGKTCSKCKNGYYINSQKYCTAQPSTCTNTISNNSGCVVSNGQKSFNTFVVDGMLVSEDIGVVSSSGVFTQDGVEHPNYGKGAIEYCNSLGMKVPTTDQLKRIVSNKSNNSIFNEYDYNDSYYWVWDGDPNFTSGAINSTDGEYFPHGSACVNDICHTVCVYDN